MSAFLDSIVARAKENKKRIVLAEGDDERTLAAAERALEENIADIIILGDVEEIKASPYKLDGATLIDPNDYEKSDELAEMLFEIRKKKGMTLEKANELVREVLYLGVMLVKAGLADGMVAGANHVTADVLRPSLQILKTAPDVKIVSSFFIMVVPDCEYGENGTFLYSDCGLEVQPTAERLASIALTAADSFQYLIGKKPYVAMISHSTWGSARNDDSHKVLKAVRIAQEFAPDIALDGEMQVDAAIIPEVAEMKAPGSPVAGRANVLVFPDLDAGSASYKLTHRLAKAEAYGPITQGIAAPVNDLSRGCSAQDIFGVIAITCVQAQRM